MTSEHTLDTEALHQILGCLWPVRDKWRQIGLGLSIDDTTLNVIRDDNPHHVDDCITSKLQEWLKNDNSCWKVLAEALRSPPVGATVKEGKF